MRAALIVSAVFVWIAMTGFGGILVETIVIYPNVFHDPPASLASAVDFFAVTGPADLFPPLGAATAVAAAVALALAWRTRARWWFVAALGSLLVGEFLFSVLFFWPRNEIMFDDGAAVHTAEVLRQAAAEFEAGHLLRLAMSGVTAALAFTGLLRLHRERAS